MNDEPIEDIEIMDTRGIIVTEIRCPSCGYSFRLDGNLDRTIIDCPECSGQLRVRVLP